MAHLSKSELISVRLLMSGQVATLGEPLVAPTESTNIGLFASMGSVMGSQVEI